MNRSIFYLDDETSLLEIFQEMFGDEYEVSTASTLDEARRVLAECPADIIISDQLMPEIEGTKFLAEAARMCPHSFRVLLTGKALVGDVIPEISAGIVHLFMRKPWSESEMREALERAENFLDSSGKPRRKRREEGEK
ncbi:MAG: response regulator [Acidobacteria bacterium]|nr:response regulator [Acidobacteriota bacterium]